MSKTFIISSTILILGFVLIVAKVLFFRSKPVNDFSWQNPFQKEKEIILPQPRYQSEISIEEALLKRRSVREYKEKPLSLQEISQLLWAVQGITDFQTGKRTAPSADVLYP